MGCCVIAILVLSTERQPGELEHRSTLALAVSARCVLCYCEQVECAACQ